MVALAYIVAGFAWTLLDPSSAGRGVARAPASQPRASTSTFAYRAAGGGIDPFRTGVFDAAAEGAGEAPVSMLNLKVVGARRSTADQAGSAIILTPDNVQRVYRAGEEIIDGVELYRVEDDRVLLRRQGVVEALPFATRELALLVNAPAADAQAASSEPDVASTEEAAAAARPERRSVAGAALMGSVAPRPAPDGEDGVALYPRGDGTAFAAAGFEPGDVVKTVNGMMVADAGRLNEVFADLGRGSVVNVRVERGRETTSLAFVLE